MYNISNKFFWIPLYLLFLYLLIKHYKKDAVWIILATVILIALSDLISVHAFKNTFLRLRPCHNPEIQDLVHLVNNKCGGKYGFYSSHASNHFAIATFMSLFLGSKIKYFTIILIIWAIVISYSRIYLGVHYPADVLAGGLSGIIQAIILYKLLVYIKPVFID